MNACQYTTDVPDAFIAEVWRVLHPWACVAEPEVEYLLRREPLRPRLRRWLQTTFVTGQCWQKDDAGMAWCQR